MSPILGWTFALVFFVAPLIHVALSPRGGPFRPPEGTSCPLGPRVGWLVIVLLAGPLGWLVYMMRRRGSGDRAPRR
jgi:hypothetical protein